MSSILKDLLASGKVILTDTKSKKPLPPKVKASSLSPNVESDPHKNLIKRAINEKLSKKELVEFFTKMCREAEDKV